MTDYQNPTRDPPTTRDDPTTRIEPPARANAPRSTAWQDWANVVLAVWLFFSPWILQFGSGSSAAQPAANGVAAAPAAQVLGAAAWNAWVLGVIIFLVALSTLGRFGPRQEWVNLLLGAWVFVAPWVLRFATAEYPKASWDHWIVGALVFLVSASAISQLRGPTGRLNRQAR